MRKFYVDEEMRVLALIEDSTPPPGQDPVVHTTLFTPRSLEEWREDKGDWCMAEIHVGRALYKQGYRYSLSFQYTPQLEVEVVFPTTVKGRLMVPMPSYEEGPVSFDPEDLYR